MRALLAGPPSLRTVRRWTGVALFFQWFIVITGATVRLTGSGLGCPNWPTCTKTRPVPALETHALIEFLNRMTSTPTLVAAAGTCWVAWRIAGGPRRDLRIATSLVVLGILVQAVLGALTVILELPPEIVAVHFLVSVALIAAATFAWVAAGSPTRLRLVRGRARGIRTGTGAVMLASLLAVIVAGVLTTASGPHSGGASSGLTIDRFGIFGLAVTLHARGAYAFLVLLLLLSWWRRTEGGPALRDLGVVIGLVVVQIALGEIQYRDGLPWGVVLAHVANAGLLWASAVRVAVGAAFEPEPAPTVQHAEADPTRRSRTVVSSA